ncbi:hypothetical protein H4K36_34040 [Streptomyces sp. DHE7-1]|nr:hypothetical protein [Streptomyces sp. DHE7-1]
MGSLVGGDQATRPGAARLRVDGLALAPGRSPVASPAGAATSGTSWRSRSSSVSPSCCSAAVVPYLVTPRGRSGGE